MNYPGRDFPSARAADLLTRSAWQYDSGAASAFGRRVRLGLGLLQIAFEEATELVECNDANTLASLDNLRARALAAIRDSAWAAIDLINFATAGKTFPEFAIRHAKLARRRGDLTNKGLVDFLESARQLASLIADPLTDQLHTLRDTASADSFSGEDNDSIFARLSKLTGREMEVLALIVEGLPNKVIAYKLSICETTVKAHVGSVLRKLRLTSRARAIVALTQLCIKIK